MASTASTPGRKPRPGSTARRPPYDLESLLAVSVQVFTERGYDGTSMEDLSRASGITKSSFYHHFSGKEQLLRLALERALEPLLASTREPGATTGRAIERLRYIIRRDVEILTERLPYVTLLLRVHGNTETERWALTQRRGFDKIVARLVQDAIDEGDVRPTVDARTAARLIFGTINSVIEWYRPGTDNSADDLADQMLTMVFDGIGSGRPRAPRRTG
jgi:AcrR family transcriptional regulator